MNIVNKQTKVKIGLAMIGFGLILSGLAIHQILNPIQPPDTLKIKNDLIAGCKIVADEMEVESINKNGSISINIHSVNEWESDIVKLSIIANSCHGFKIHSFCMGNQCRTATGGEIQGSTMALVYTGKLHNIRN